MGFDIGFARAGGGGGERKDKAVEEEGEEELLLELEVRTHRVEDVGDDAEGGRKELDAVGSCELFLAG